MTAERKTHLGWLGPAIVIIGALVAAVGVWYLVHARPSPGAELVTYRVDNDRTLVVRAETGGSRNFLELRDGKRVVWQAIIPPYGGGLAWSDKIVGVRIIRDHHAEVFALSMGTASKVGGFTLAPEKGPVTEPPVGPATLTDHEQAYEIVGGAGWHQLVAWGIDSGEPAWKQELPGEAITEGGVERGTVWIVQGGKRLVFDAKSGKPLL